MNGRMNGKKSQVKPEELIVNELIQAIESGNTKLWRKEWTVKGGFRNVLTGHDYQGGNPALLCLQSSIRNWHLPLFIGAGQARSINCLPKKGSKSAISAKNSDFSSSSEVIEAHRAATKRCLYFGTLSCVKNSSGVIF